MSLRFIIFGGRTVLPDGHHSGIIVVSTYRSVNSFLNAFCTDSNFFCQKFWMPYIPSAVQLFRLAISFVFSSVMTNSLTRFALSPSSVFSCSIHYIFGNCSSCSRYLSKTQQITASRTFHLRSFPLLPGSQKNLFGLTGI